MLQFAYSIKDIDFGDDGETLDKLFKPSDDNEIFDGREFKLTKRPYRTNRVDDPTQITINIPSVDKAVTKVGEVYKNWDNIRFSLCKSVEREDYWDDQGVKFAHALFGDVSALCKSTKIFWRPSLADKAGKGSIRLSSDATATATLDSKNGVFTKSIEPGNKDNVSNAFKMRF